MKRPLLCLLLALAMLLLLARFRRLHREGGTR